MLLESPAVGGTLGACSPVGGARPPSRLTFQQVSKHRWVLILAHSGDQSVSFPRSSFLGGNASCPKLVVLCLCIQCGCLFILVFFFPAFSLFWWTIKVFLSAFLVRYGLVEKRGGTSTQGTGATCFKFVLKCSIRAK